MWKKVVIRVAVLLLIFCGSVLVIGRIINEGTPNTTQEMSGATQPLVYMKNDGTLLNCLHGYTEEMDVTSMRDSLTPINEDRSLDIQVDLFSTKVSDITFEVLTADGTKTMENTKVTKLQTSQGSIEATLQLQNPILMNKEYMLKIQLTSGGKKIYYYTRIIQQDGLHTKQYLDYANGFYERCINGNDTGVIAEAVESDDTGDNTNFAHVDIHSSVNQLCWAGLNPSVYLKPTPKIKELNETTATIVMDYMITAKNESGQTELYQVWEYYRLRYTDARIYLLNFERSTIEVFNPDNDVLISKGIKIGVAGKDVAYKSDKENNFFAFVQAGDLWQYDVSSGKLSEVFSFREKENTDRRDSYGQHGIEIINVESNGSMYFLVYGYMNRGSHEGQAGVAVYYYDAPAVSIEEKAFISTKQSFELLQKDMDALAYVTEDEQNFYLLVEGQVYGVNLVTRELEHVVENLNSDCYVSSESGKQFAWLDENEAYNSRTLKIIDLDTKQIREITCQENERLRPIGFMAEDIVYGIANQGDISIEHEGQEFFPMKELKIVNSAGEEVKNYAWADTYVTNGEISEKLLTLTRVKKQGGTFISATEEHIVNSAADEETAYGLTTQVTERKQTETILRVGAELRQKTAQVVHSRQIIYEGSRTVELPDIKTDEVLYYVYAKGQLDSIYVNVNTAVNRADEVLGIVVDSRQQYIWERGNKKDKVDRLDVTKLPVIVKQGNMNINELTEALGKQIVDLSGCSLDAVLYYVSEGTPVLAKTKDGVEVICGYDFYNTILLKPGDEEARYYGLEESEELFKEAGNIFVTYLDPVTE